MKKSEITIGHVYNEELEIIKPQWKGNVKINGEFHNSEVPEKPPLKEVLKWLLSKNPQKKEKKVDSFQLKTVELTQIPKDKDNVVWLGHSSFLITVNGVTLITDPLLFNLPNTKRKVALPCGLEVLSGIDYILISHNHRDHLDIKSIKLLVKNNPDIVVLTGLNTGNCFKNLKIKTENIQEAGWYQVYKTASEITVAFLPAQHWARRGLRDYNKDLWGGFMIDSGHDKIFFSGDTSYSLVFNDIQQTCGSMDYCLLPIGAYSPQFLMKISHTTPEEAIKIFEQLNGKTMIPMHYATYDLSDEPIGEPLQRFKKAFPKDKSSIIPDVGEVIYL